MDPINYDAGELSVKKEGFLKDVRAKLSVRREAKPRRTWTPMINDEHGNHYLKILYDRENKDKQIQRFINKTKFYQAMKLTNQSSM